MPLSPIAKRLAGKIAIALLGVLLPLAAAEIALRLTKLPKNLEPAFCASCSYVLALDAKAEGVSSQGLRDREYAIPAPEGVYRILVLGDSVAFGSFVTPEQSFPKVLERELGRAGKVEVINAGVPMYTSYNELHYYLEKGRAFRPDLVVMAFCMNDVADPLLHWRTLLPPDADAHVPEAAVPDPVYHREHAIPLAKRRARSSKPPPTGFRLQGLELYGRLIRPLIEPAAVSVNVGGKSYPTYVTGDDSLGIQVLMDYDSPQWTWLRAMYDELAAAVKSDGAKLAIVWSPLSPHMDPSYPFLPQPLFARYCRERGIPCLDVLPALRAHAAERMFLNMSNQRLDIWHYTPAGHRVVARELARFLAEQGLFPPGKP